MYTWAALPPRAIAAPDPLIGRGLRGRIQTPVGLWLPFAITHWEPEHAWAWRVAGIDATGHRVDPFGPERCRVIFEIPRWAPFYRLVCQTALHRIEQRARTGRGCPFYLGHAPPLAFNKPRYEIKPTCLGLRQPADALA
jgi:hypothetical protein